MGIIKEWLRTQRLRNQLMEVFGKAGLYTEHQTRGDKVSKKVK
ncbi:hypothetical protein [Bacillus cereus group sp. BfR-BA-01352]|nr:hypothetical protein [Bacillus cereus group sp. BfR-BA-01352]